MQPHKILIEDGVWGERGLAEETLNVIRWETISQKKKKLQKKKTISFSMYIKNM